ncbi:SusD/RagB family nutrient-binding outer membrane lipoprotein [Pedobacter sp. PAMC26386]|nr:SusD/RagB family nutrient-binding outer membrane lipoprotein [Pedobacter sp. PAMC26386]
MKITKYISFFCLSMVILTACKKTEDLQKNPSAIINVSPKLLFTGLLLNSSQAPWTSDQRNNQYMVLNESYYGNQSYDWTTSNFDTYAQLRNVVRMEIEAQKQTGTLGAPYLTLAKFFRAYFFVSMTEMFGDIPMSEALQGTSNGNFTPKYDSQKDIYIQCLKWLEEANAAIIPLVKSQTKAEGDFYYNGDLSQWQKLINSFRLRVLISLSKRADDSPELNVKQQFSNMVNNPDQYPLILTNTDNFKLVYNTSDVSNNYPLWPSNGIVIKQDLRNSLGATFVNIAVKTKDARLFVVALPTDSAKVTNTPGYASQFTSYRGGKTGELQTTLKDQAISGKLSMINFDYWLASPSGIPSIQLGASETNFNIAEAINRGWIGGDAAKYFNAGIEESFKFYGASSAIPAFEIQNPYLGNTPNGLTQILEQKYVAFFQNSGKQAFYNYRRTGIPKFDVGPANANNNQIPVRWAYPIGEYTVNTANLKASLQAQFNGADSQNGVMWLIK